MEKMETTGNDSSVSSLCSVQILVDSHVGLRGNRLRYSSNCLDILTDSYSSGSPSLRTQKLSENVARVVCQSLYISISRNFEREKLMCSTLSWECGAKYLTRRYARSRFVYVSFPEFLTVLTSWTAPKNCKIGKS